MLCLMRKQDQWVTITCKETGKKIDVRVTDIKGKTLRLVFNDDERNFDVTRPEAKSGKKPEESGE